MVSMVLEPPCVQYTAAAAFAIQAVNSPDSGERWTSRAFVNTVRVGMPASIAAQLMLEDRG